MSLRYLTQYSTWILFINICVPFWIFIWCGWSFLSMSAGKSDSCGLTSVVEADDSLTEMLHVTVFLYWSDMFYIFVHIFLTHSNSYSGWNEFFFTCVFIYVSMMVTHIVGKYCSFQTVILSCIYRDLSMWK